MKVQLGTVLGAAAVALSAPAYAATTIVFQTGGTNHEFSGFGDYYTYNLNLGGLAATLTATGWTDNISYNPDKIQKADLELYAGSAYGLGVVASGDSASGSTHTADNAGSTKDFIVLKFSTAVNLSKAYFNVFDVNPSGPKDGDATVYYKNGAVAPTNGGSAPTYFSQFTAINVPGSASGLRNVAGPGIASDTWVVAARLDQSDDAFKLYSIVVDRVAVPEPATWAMMLIGFGGVGTMIRGRRKALRSALA